MRDHPAFTDPEPRRPVWEALSTLFLDTDVSLLEEYRAEKLAASPFSLDELQEILIDEVYPACRWNLFSIAGVWDGFDEGQLERRILRRLSSPFRGLHRINLGRVTIHLSLAWRSTKVRVGEFRARPRHRHPLVPAE